MRQTRVVLVVALLSGLLTRSPALAGSHAASQPSDTPGSAHLATILTAVNIPARGVLCGLSGVLGSVVMAASGGTRYADAANLMREGCSGPWVISPRMVERQGGDRDPEASCADPPWASGVVLSRPYGVAGARLEQTPPPLPAVPLPSGAQRGVEGPAVIEQTVRIGEAATPSAGPERMFFPDIAFRFNSADLTDLGKGQVYLAARRLKQNAEMVLVIEGHADSVGTREYNRRLGLLRAERVIQELRDLGVDPARFSPVSAGESQPLIDLDTDWARAVNRRVEFRVVAP